MTAQLDRTGPYRWRDVWPRRGDRPLPPGQRVVGVMPRFSSRPLKAPPPPATHPTVQVSGAVGAPIAITIEDLAAVPRRDQRSDLHCVTTWTVPDLRWSGWRLVDVWERLVIPGADPHADASHIRVRGRDGYWAVLDLEDAFRDDVLLADALESAPLDAAHGAPLRLVSPRQYAYKSVKHVSSISVHLGAPTRFGGAIEHPRARVSREERHEYVPGRLLRVPYRALILPTAMLAQRSATTRPTVP